MKRDPIADSELEHFSVGAQVELPLEFRLPRVFG
jgi:hypothetical protein